MDYARIPEIVKLPIRSNSCIYSQRFCRKDLFETEPPNQGKKRYSELKQQIVGVSPKMLIQNLRNLERCGLIEREIYPSVLPHVDYSLTPLGESLVEPLAILGEWAYRHIPEVKAAMEQYDDNSKENYWEPK